MRSRVIAVALAVLCCVFALGYYAGQKRSTETYRIEIAMPSVADYTENLASALEEVRAVYE